MKIPFTPFVLNSCFAYLPEWAKTKTDFPLVCRTSIREIFINKNPYYQKALLIITFSGKGIA